MQIRLARPLQLLLTDDKNKKRMSVAISNENLMSLWSLLDGPSFLLDQIQQEGPHIVFPSAFDVTGLATDRVSLANLAVAELFSVRANETIPQIKINTIEASAAFKTAGIMKPDGWTLPSIWDAIAGDYLAKDRWIRIHTNYQYHREAVLKVLQVQNDKQKVADKMSCFTAEWLQEEISDDLVA